MTLRMHRDLLDSLQGGGAAEMVMEDSFCFQCDDRCLGRCCNTIKIMLDPWDVEAMARHLEITGKEFLENFCALEEDPQSGWPYVKLLEAEKGPCAFLMDGGRCRVYPARSRNCRTYPVGRAVRFGPDGQKEEKYFLVEKQKFCFGHNSDRRWTLREWLEDSGAPAYYEKSDLYFELVSYAVSVLQVHRWMNSRVAMIMMPFLYGPEVLRSKMGLTMEAVGHEEFYLRRLKALKVFLTEMAAGFGFGPLVRDNGEEVEDKVVMDAVRKILLNS